MKRGVALVAALLLACTLAFAGGKSDKRQEVYFLNFKAEITDVYTKEVKPAFEAENPGYSLKVVTATSGGYEQTLRSEISKSAPPVIFQVIGPVGLERWKDYTADLSDTQLYALLSDKSMALTEGGAPVAVPYAVEGYGIIYNDAIMRAYFALPNKAVSINSAEEIADFETLKAVVEDMQANVAELGIQGVFASTSMSAGNQWRWQTHAMNIALFHEFYENAPTENTVITGLNSSTISFKYGNNLKDLLDLYTNNSTTAKSLLGAKSVDDSMAEFALGQCAMVQNGNWAAAQILGVRGNKVASEDIKFLPIYMGIPGEGDYGISVGTENYLCINKTASPEAQKAADVFLTWLFSSETGKRLVSEKLMFITPFNSFAPDELPSDPLSQEVSRWMNKPGVTSVPWTFASMPSEEWKNRVGSALLEYFEGADWSVVENTVINEWTSEWNLKNGR